MRVVPQDFHKCDSQMETQRCDRVWHVPLRALGALRDVILLENGKYLVLSGSIMLMPYFVN